mmetsp:Transcript_30993/g.45977  ORF Transcript_30993/g.45977 Transcript_30993/m.45977 type:complete len:801 (-) Transcript_30993:234-2636(-)|eukprot:CAMPEP_0194036338 /NCGR_PEP_ID=MMETSP0009_2-20130614/8681_1 /TAXON_ID=210454 /ORGANISM="Grammatophora oceanica, Strain CCMP 410" /LENGTH=800 /DNA_ID=CAMNT_0038678041 /DNA_START=128 /DNA_END=2530 /DNA_ORIENTATION=+
MSTSNLSVGDVCSMISGNSLMSSDDATPIESIELETKSDADDLGTDKHHKPVEVTCCTTNLAKERRLRSSRASSLLDDDPLDDDEPDLEVTDDDDATSNSTSADDYGEPQDDTAMIRPTTPSRPGTEKTLKPTSPNDKRSLSPSTDPDGAQPLVLSPMDEKKGVDKLVCLADGMITNYLCPTTVDSSDADAIRIQVQTNNTMRDAINRSESDIETDTRASSDAAGRWSTTAIAPSQDNQDCYSSVLPNTNNHGEHTSQHSDATPKQRNTICSDLASLSEMRQLVAADVAALLGTSRGAWLMALRDWLLQPVCTHRYHGSASSNSSSSACRRVIRNRISVRQKQTRRMQQLWLEWHAQSLDNMEDPASCNKNTSPRTAAGYGPPLIWSLGMTRSLDDSHLNTRTDDANIFGTHARKQDKFSDTFYDSDPESFRRSRVLKRRTQHNGFDDYEDDEFSSYRPPAPINTVASYASPTRIPTAPRNCRKRAPSAGAPRSAPSFGLSSSSTCTAADDGENVGNSCASFDTNKFDLRNDTMVEQFLKEVTFRKIPLVIHPNAASSSDEGDDDDGDDEEKKEPDKDSRSVAASNKSPISVQGWFEMGSRLENRVIQPKFMWRKTYQPNLSTHRKLSCETPDSIELLSMVRILKPTQLNRKHFPFAKVDHSFSILANNKDLYLFEAQSSQERDWIVHGLKLVVARLASMIIVGDEQMFVEFFSPWAHSPVLDDDAFLRAKGSSDDDKEDDRYVVQVETSSNEDENNTGVGVAAKFVPNSGGADRKSLWGVTGTTTKLGNDSGEEEEDWA